MKIMQRAVSLAGVGAMTAALLVTPGVAMAATNVRSDHTTITSPDGGARATFQVEGDRNTFYVKDLEPDGHWVYGQYRIGSYTSPKIYVQSDKKDDYVSTRLGEAPTEIQVCTVYAPLQWDNCTGWTKVS